MARREQSDRRRACISVCECAVSRTLKHTPPLPPPPLLPDSVIHTFYSSQEIDFYPKKLSGIHVFFCLRSRPCEQREDARSALSLTPKSPPLSAEASPLMIPVPPSTDCVHHQLYVLLIHMEGKSNTCKYQNV